MIPVGRVGWKEELVSSSTDHEPRYPIQPLLVPFEWENLVSQVQSTVVSMEDAKQHVSIMMITMMMIDDDDW